MARSRRLISRAVAIVKVAVVLGFVVCLGVAKLMRLPPATARSFAFTAGLYNYGYLPIPLVQEFHDKSTLGVLFTHNLGVEIALWTVGVWILSGSSGKRM